MSNIVTDLSGGISQGWDVGVGFHNTFTITCTLSSAAFDTSTYTFAIRIYNYNKQLVQTLSQGSGITNGGASGVLTIVLTAAQSALLTDGEYRWELVATHPDTFLYRWAKGNVNALTDGVDGDSFASLSIPLSLSGSNIDLAISLPGGGVSEWADLEGSPEDNTDLTTYVEGVADAKVADAINNGTTDVAPSQNAVFDALALKADLTAVIGLQDLFIPASAMWPRTTSGCASLAKTEMTTSLFNIQTLDFDTTTQEFAQFQIALPRNWNNGTVTAKVYWTAASGSGGVVWGISGGAYSDDDALTVAFGTAQTVADTLLAANDLHATSYTSAITLAGSPADADFLAFQISRNPSDGSDTLGVDAKLLGVVITLTTDTGVAA